MKPLLSLSTSWCSHRHNDGYAMLREMADLGFEYVELSHGIRITLVPGVLRAIEEGVVKVSSTHNFCPLPTGITRAAPNVFEPTSRDARERDQWLRHTRRSIDFASQIGSGVLVCHLGSVNFLFFDPVGRLSAYKRKHPGVRPADDPAYAALVGKAVAKLRKRMPPFWDNMRECVSGVLEHAMDKGVRLGFENREKFSELPVDADYPEFISSLPSSSPVGYWHDTGHARIKERLGLIDAMGQIAANAGRLLGFHLHDVDKEGNDHQPIGTGEIDFEAVSRFWRPEHRLTIELSPHLTREEVILSRDHIRSLIDARFGA